jgi:hypothetical protein
MFLIWHDLPSRAKDSLCALCASSVKNWGAARDAAAFTTDAVDMTQAHAT